MFCYHVVATYSTSTDHIPGDNEQEGDSSGGSGRGRTGGGGGGGRGLKKGRKGQKMKKTEVEGSLPSHADGKARKGSKGK